MSHQDEPRTDEHPAEQRAVDRRRRPTRPWDCLRHPGRRRGHRRAADLGPYAFVDRYDRTLGVMILLVLLLTLTDGVLTTLLMDRSCEEANPLMALLIERGPMDFILGKYLITALGLPVLLVFQHHRMFGTRFRVRHLFPVFLTLYLALLVYQIHLFRITAVPDPDPPRTAVLADSREAAHR